MKIEVHPSRAAASAAAARAAAGALHELKTTRDAIGVIFATGASQIDTLKALTLIGNLPWHHLRFPSWTNTSVFPRTIRLLPPLPP